MFDSEVLEPGTAGITVIAEPPGFTEAERNALIAWDRVCELPQKTLMTFGYEPDGKRSGVGFEVKDGTTSSDRKLDMHLTLRRQDEQLLRADEVDSSGALREFILSIGTFILAAEPAILEYARQKGGEEYEAAVRAARGEWMARGLSYPPGVVAGDILAAGHTDKGDFSLDGRANHGQMEYLQKTDPPTWIPVPRIEDKLVFMPGISLQARTGSRIVAAGHQVRATPQSERFGRKVLVIFVDSHGTYYFNKKLHGSQQSMWREKLGWNYPDKEREDFHREFITHFTQ
jgi:hypothetical protein